MDVSLNKKLTANLFITKLIAFFREKATTHFASIKLMTQNRIQGRFYPLKSEEWLESIKQLTHSELKILYYVRSLEPYNKGINLTPAQIAKDLSTEESKMHRSTVGRALKSLDSKGFIKMELLQVRIKVNPKGLLSEEPTDNVVVTQPSCKQTTPVVTPQPNVPPRNMSCSHATECASTQQSSPEIQSEKRFQIPKTNKTYLDFKKTLSESKRESFFKFVEKKIQNLSQPVNDLEAWLASKTKINQNRWEVYYQKYQEENKVSKISSNSSSINSEERKTAITRFKAEIRQQKPSKREKDNKHKDEFNRLLDNPNGTIKSIEQPNNQSKQVQKPLGKTITEGYEQIRDLKVSQYFANTSTSLAGGLA